MIMNSERDSNNAWTTREIGWLLIAIATAIQIARVVGMTAAHGELPFLSANDRSRWSAMVALTEEGIWEIDRVIEILDSKGKSKIWNTIDMVRHTGADGREHFYSSKPPLLTAIYAVVTKSVAFVTGKKLTEEPFLIGRTVLLIVNVLPLCIWWLWYHRWLENHVADAWSRFMMLNMGLWGTFLTTFAATLNNHLHAALLFAWSLAILWGIIHRAQAGQSQSWWTWIGCGMLTGLTVACELPALSWAAVAGAILLMIDWKKFLIGYGFGTASIAVAFLGTNYWAHQDWRPPYSHRGVGQPIASITRAGDETQPAIASVIEQANQNGYSMSEGSQIIPARLTDVLQCIDQDNGQRVAIQLGSDSKTWTIYRWDDWYDFPKSYWLPGNKKGVDLGENDRVAYLVHFLIGHHGIYSLTPFWLLSIFGAVICFKQKQGDSPFTGIRKFVLSNHGMTTAFLLMTLSCFVFYVSRSVEDRNYGGVSSGFRWSFWLIPAWLWLCVPAVQLAARSVRARWIVGGLLVVSVFSSTIPWPNPWTHPWPYRVGLWMDPVIEPANANIVPATK